MVEPADRCTLIFTQTEDEGQFKASKDRDCLFYDFRPIDHLDKLNDVS